MKCPRHRHLSDKGSQNPPLKHKLSSQVSTIGFVGGLIGTIATLVWLFSGFRRIVELCIISWSLALVICRTWKKRMNSIQVAFSSWEKKVSSTLTLMVFLQLLGCFDPKIELWKLSRPNFPCCPPSWKRHSLVCILQFHFQKHCYASPLALNQMHH